jgi:hypothetical protein
VIHNDTVKEILVSILQCDQVQIPVKIGGLFPDVVQDPEFLLGHAVDPRWQQSPQIEGVTFRFGKSGAFVAHRVVQNFDALVLVRG